MSTGEPWIAYTQERPDAKLRLFCFHFAGGAASVFRTWQASLPESVEVRPVQLPGRESRLREPLRDSMDQVLNGLLEPVSGLMDVPAVFFGHSMGGLVGFELIRRLRRKNRTLPLHFFAAGRRSPRAQCRFPDIHDLSHDDLIDAMRKYGATPEAILADAEMMDLLLPIVRADFKVLETYTYIEEDPLELPVTVYAGKQDVRTTPEELTAWQKETSGAFVERMFDGEHFFINTHKDSVLAALSADLESILKTL